MAAIARPVLPRQLQLRIHPRPSNLAESRAIYRLMAQFGEIDYWRSLKYDALPVPNTVLMSYKQEGAAQKALRGSPVRFLMARGGEVEGDPTGAREGREHGAALRETEQGLNNVEDVGALERGSELQGATWGRAPDVTRSSRGPPSTSSRRPDPQHQGPSFGQNRFLSTRIPNPPPQRASFPMIEPSYTPPPNLKDGQEKPRMFQIFANVSRAKFRDQINYGHYHGSFVVGSDSVQEAMAKRLPHAMKGLSVVDWKRGDRPWRLVGKEREKIWRETGEGKGLGDLWREGQKGGERSPE